MIFDFEILTFWHGGVAALCAAVTFVVIGAYILWCGQRRGNAVPVGPVLIAVIALTAFFALSETKLRIGIVLAAIATIYAGRADEQQPRSPRQQFVWQLLIVALVVINGWTIPYVSHPGGAGILDLRSIHIGSIILPGSILAVIWLLGTINAMNWLDGSDGLAGSVGLAGFLTLAGISLLPGTQDTHTLMLAAIGAGTLAGFLYWNWFPARVYLGTTGSWFIGLYIGMVAMFGGGKIATTLLVLAWPALDAVLVIAQRLWQKKRPWQGDRHTHFHYHLAALGLKAATIAIVAGISSALLGVTAITLHTHQKLLALCMVALTMAATIAIVIRSRYNSH